MTLVWAAIHDRCACNQPITTEPYFGLLMGEDQDEDAIVYFDPAHLPCMGEWGVALDPDSPLGLGHAVPCDQVRLLTADEQRYYTLTEDTGDEDIRPS